MFPASFPVRLSVCGFFTVVAHSRRGNFVVRVAAVFDTDSWGSGGQEVDHKAADLALDSLERMNNICMIKS